ncbi:MAG: glycosyltransferase family 2 protein [Candidatus Hodarchaeota archaeon]
MMKSDFLVVIPAFNEEKSLPRVIKQLTKIFKLNQLILADDGSTDNSAGIAKDLGIKILRNPKNLGKGFILRNAFKVILHKYTHIRWIITFDADGQHNYQDILHFFSTLRENPTLGIIIGKRDYIRMPKKNWISNLLTSHWCKYWLRWTISDLQCGFRCYNREALQQILSYGLTKTKFDLETEILLIAWLLNIKIKEIPISTLYIKNHRKSRVTPLLDTVRWMLLILQYGFSLNFIRQIWYRRQLQ